MPKIKLVRPIHPEDSDCEPYYIPESVQEPELSPELKHALRESNWNKALFALLMYHRQTELVLGHTVEFAERVSKCKDLIKEQVDFRPFRFYMMYIQEYRPKMVSYKKSLLEILPYLSDLYEFFVENKEKIDFITKHEPLIVKALNLASIRLFKLLLQMKDSWPPDDKSDSTAPQ